MNSRRLNRLKYSPLVVAVATALVSHLAWAESQSKAFFEAGTLYLPETDAGSLGTYSVALKLATMEPMTFDLVASSLTPVTASGQPDAIYDPVSGKLTIAAGRAGENWYTLQMQQLSMSGEFRFTVTNLTAIQVPDNTNGSYPIVDTHQTVLFGANSSTTFSTLQSGQDFFGQDANYLGNTPSYTDNGDGTITDNVTGLMWQQDPDINGDGKIDSSDMLSFADAKAGASSFNLAGYTDWRLPTIKELYSLIDFSGSTGTAAPSSTSVPNDAVPYIDTTYFKFSYGDIANGLRYIDAQYWSSTEYVSTTMAGVISTAGSATAFGVNFADGRIKGYGSEYRIINDGRFVRYVRGNSSYGLNSFNDNGDGTITDSATSLMWLQNDSGHFNAGSQSNGSLNWQEALAWCEDLNYADHTDWRLPNAKELQSLVDYSRSPKTTNSAAIDPLFKTTAITDEGGNTNYPFYWSSTTHRDGPDFAVYLAFGEALGCMAPNGSSTKIVTDVHGAGAQRSDPKTANTTIGCGNGPQGDVIRVYNYARCVRGGTATQNTKGDNLDVVVNNSGSTTTDNTTSSATTPPQEAIDACSGLSQGNHCTVQATPNNVTGTCGLTPDNTLACIPET